MQSRRHSLVASSRRGFVRVRCRCLAHALFSSAQICSFDQFKPQQWRQHQYRATSSCMVKGTTTLVNCCLPEHVIFADTGSLLHCNGIVYIFFSGAIRLETWSFSFGVPTNYSNWTNNEHPDWMWSKSTMMAPTRQHALRCYKQLLRTRLVVFKG